jgi:hypothetical protein
MQPARFLVYLESKAINDKLRFGYLVYKAFIHDLGLTAEFDQCRQFLPPVLLNLFL